MGGSRRPVGREGEKDGFFIRYLSHSPPGPYLGAAPLPGGGSTPIIASVPMRIPTLRGTGASLLRSLGLFGMLAVLLAASPALAQSATVSGQIIDAETGDALIGATVTVPGTNRGAATDLDGNYSFALAPGAYTLRASFIGYEAEEIQVTLSAGQTLVQNFGLAPDLTGLETVVVTGALSSRSRSRSEVAVSSVDAAALTETTPYQDVAQLLNGKIAGVSVQPASGNVGGGVRFNVRAGGGLNGSGQPLIFIDGVRVNTSEVDGLGAGGQGVGALSDINPDDIANVEVLKGPAAAALYGTDASNGVVLITTQKGTIGSSTNGEQPLRIDYQGVAGANTQQFEYDELTAGATAANANAIFEDGEIQQHTLSLSGGSNTVRYFTQFDTRSEDGIVFGNYQDRRSMRANFEAFPLTTLQIGANAAYSFNTVGQPQNDNNVLGYLGNTLLFPFPYAFTDSAAVRAIDTRYRSNRFIGSVNARYAPLQNLSLSANVGIDALDNRGDQTFPPNFAYSGTNNGNRLVYTRENDQVSFQLDGRYRFEPTDAFTTTTAVGVQGFDQRIRTFTFSVEDLPSRFLLDTGTGADFQGSGEFFGNVRQFGLLAEQSFDYDDTFFGAIGVRNDYASTLGTEAPSIVYPTARAAVRLDQFDAVPSLFSILKLRAAYGESGQLPGTFDGIPLLYTAEVGGDGSGAVPLSIGNEEVEPERVGEFETGLDIEFADRLGVELTYYRQQARQSIFDVEQAPSTGLVASNIPFNVGRIDGQGVELAINATPYATRTASVDLGAIVNYQTNEVKELGFDELGNPNPPLFDGFDLNVIRPGICPSDPTLGPENCPTDLTDGLPRAAFYTTPVNGALFDDAGNYAGVDAGIRPDNIADFQDRLDSGECELNPDTGESRCFMGIPYPEFNGSFNANVRVGGFTFYALADWATGLSVFNNTDLFRSDFGNYQQRNDLADQLFGYTDEDGNEVPGLTPGTDEYREVADAYARTSGAYDANFIREADYIKLREISVKYNLAGLIARTPGLERVRSASLSFAARNVWQSSKYDGLDPEVNFAGGRSLSRGQDFLTLQNPRVYYVTLQLGI